MSTTSALLHPVRLRIVQTLLAKGTSTTRDLHERLGDIPIATLYRHIAYLSERGLIEVDHERQVRGASEKSYRVTGELANPTAEELAASSSEELLAAFTVFVSGTIRDFGDYLDEGDFDLAEDRVSFAQAEFWATDAEMDAFAEGLMAVLRPLLANDPARGRRRRALTTVLMPRPTDETR
ncbi:helix-turn-helix domain-containing protein [Microbacterium oxydans]|uniref:helix-turn-helix domain-containing protein n=1 Tax=Microbacterium sp. B19(2022) TaxID=2914045 RepID=UPI0014310C38|nr:helix-turn-helix domain-containing protein [Microbacterium sp. B19(2022)]NJI59780.1 helix-turn-helix domain-containing protein [Microbacterium sp. B19(2022)]